LTQVRRRVTRAVMSGLDSAHAAAISLDHVGIVGSNLDALAGAFFRLGFAPTPIAEHASGRTANRCVMLRDGGYLELIATVPGQTSATIDRFLTRGGGAHILALEVDDLAAARDRLGRARIAAGDVSFTERDGGPDGVKARFTLLMAPDLPDGRVLLIRHLTRHLLWRPETTTHPNHAVSLAEVVYATSSPAETMTHLSRLSGRPAEPDPLGGYRIPLARGCLRILSPGSAGALFPGTRSGPPLIGLTVTVDPNGEPGRVGHAGGVAIRFIAAQP
jgi:hypothetical protein